MCCVIGQHSKICKHPKVLATSTQDCFKSTALSSPSTKFSPSPSLKFPLNILLTFERLKLSWNHPYSFSSWGFSGKQRTRFQVLDGKKFTKSFSPSITITPLVLAKLSSIFWPVYNALPQVKCHRFIQVSCITSMLPPDIREHLINVKHPSAACVFYISLVVSVIHGLDFIIW